MRSRKSRIPKKVMPSLKEPKGPKSRIRRIVIMVVLVSVGIHLLAAAIAGIVVVARYFSTPTAEFKVVRDIRIPAKQREHKMNMAAFDGMAPAFSDKMKSIRPAAIALPELPKMPVDQIPAISQTGMISDQISSLIGSAGLGNGQGAVGAGNAGTALAGTGMSFFGIPSNGERILLLFDVSTSVVNKAKQAGVPLSKIQEETAALLSKLPINARFGLIQFTQNYKAFSDELLPASDPNRAAALRWIEEEWVESGTMGRSKKVAANPRGIAGVLELAVSMKPDVIYLISDASFQWKESGPIENIPWNVLKTICEGPLQQAGGCKIHFVGFEMKPADKREISALCRKSGGRVQEIKR